MSNRHLVHRPLLVLVEPLETRNLFDAVTDYLYVDTSVTHQAMDGFGASMMSWAQRPEYRQSSYYNQLAGDLGANIVRAAVEPGWEATNDNSDPNVFNWSGFSDASIATAMEYFKQMKLRGANQFMLSVWSPPAWMKTNKAVANGGVLRPDFRDEFAENLAAVVIRAKQVWGVDISVISIQNEPWFVETYDSAQMTPVEMRETLRAVARKFAKEGLTTKIAVPEDVARYARFEQYVKAIQADPETAADVGVWANHYIPAGGLYDVKKLIGNTGKPYWATEVNNGSPDLSGALGVARGIDDLVNIADASAVIMWQFSGQTGKDDFNALITNNVPNTKYYAVKQYAHFIRPGAVRVDSKNDNDAVRISAYTQASNGATTIVMSNNATTDSSVQLNLSGSNLPASFNIYRTSSTENCVLVGTIAASNLMNFTLPAQSIVTFYAGPDLVTPNLSSASPFVPLVYKTDSSNTNDLRAAAMNGKYATVQSLIAGGADVNAAFGNAWTPLFEAAASPWWDSDKILKALIAAGADVQHTDNEGFTALHVAAMNQNTGWPVPAWYNAARLKVLLDAGIDVNARDGYNRTPLHWAAMLTKINGDMQAIYFDTSVVQALIDGGATLNVTDGFGKTPLDYAIAEGNTATVALLQSYLGVGSISGAVYNDANSNGAQDAGETGIAGRNVYIDLDNDGSFDNADILAITGSDGAYAFNNLSAGTYVIRQVVPGGYSDTTLTIPKTIPLSTGQTITGVNFFTAPVVLNNAVISGFAILDNNRNAANDAGDAAASGVTIYLDANNNGALDAGETSTTTAADGSYQFTGLPAGSYTLRQVLAANMVNTGAASQPTTVLAGQTLTNVNFFTAPALATLSGVVYVDANGNAAQDAGEPGSASQTVYLDANNNAQFDAGETSTTTGANGAYTFANLLAGAYTVRWLAVAGYQQTQPASNGAQTVSPTAGQTIASLNFGIRQPVSTLSGTVYNDANSNGVIDLGEAGLAGQVVFIDANNNSLLDIGETSVTTAATGTYNFTNLLAGTYTLRWQGGAGYQQVYPVGGAAQVVSPAAGQSIASINFGLKSTAGVIAGVVYNDANKNASQDAGESGISGRTVFLDANNNGTLDAGESSATTDAAGKYSLANLSAGTYRVRQVLPANWLQTAPASNAPITVTLSAGGSVAANFGAAQNVVAGTGSITGKLWKDTNRDGRRTSDETGIAGRTVYIDANGNNAFDVGETSAVTNSLGNYTLSNLPAGSYKIRQVLPVGWAQTKPFLGASLVISLTTGQASAGNDLGTNTTAAPNTGGLSGLLFKDANGNGAQDSGELGVASRTIYLDANNNGKLDAGETTTTTSASGTFLFSNLAGNITYRVRQLLPSGWMQTKPTGNASVSVQLNDGQTYAGIVFGTKTIV